MSKNVLIVDDNKDLRDIYDNCSTDKVQLTTADSGFAALQLIEKKSFDAVLLDLSMATLDGLTIAQEIRRNEQMHSKRKPLHLAFFTARTIDEEVTSVAEETNVEKIFLKPCDPFQLVEEVRIWLDNAKFVPKATNQKGASHSNAMICLFAAIVQIVVGCLFLWFNHRTEDWWAIEWATVSKQRDALKIVCDSNGEKKNSLEIWIEQNTTVKPPPELLSERLCSSGTEK